MNIEFKENTDLSELEEMAEEYEHGAVNGGRGEKGWWVEFEGEDKTVYAHTSKEKYDKFMSKVGIERVGEKVQEETTTGFTKASKIGGGK